MESRREKDSRSGNDNDMCHCNRHGYARSRQRKPSHLPRERISPNGICCEQNKIKPSRTLFPQEFEQKRVGLFRFFVVWNMRTIFKDMKFDIRNRSTDVVTVLERNCCIVSSPEEHCRFVQTSNFAINVNTGFDCIISNRRKDRTFKSFEL